MCFYDFVDDCHKRTSFHNCCGFDDGYVDVRSYNICFDNNCSLLYSLDGDVSSYFGDCMDGVFSNINSSRPYHITNTFAANISLKRMHTHIDSKHCSHPNLSY